MRIPDLYLNAVGHALGELKTHVTESEAAGRLLSTAADLTAAGFEWHHRCAPETTGYDLALAAARQLAGGLSGGADAIVYATCLPLNGNVGDVGAWQHSRDVRHLMEFPAGILQAELGLDRAVVVGLNQQACTSMLGSIRLAAALLATEPDWERVLCVAADRLPDGAIYEQSYNLVSDGAAACLVSRRPAGFRLLTAHQITNGGLARGGRDEAIGTFFSYARRLVEETVRRAGFTGADIAWVVPQNANRMAARILARLIGVEQDRMWLPSLRDAAHAISADNLINLAALMRAGKLRPGDRVLLLMAGHGLNYQAVLLQATEEAG
jgi:3-oxoacyl-[acyl-carrier-protein] synthase III